MTHHPVHQSRRLRAGVTLYAAEHGHVLRVGADLHDVRLAPDDAAALVAALVDDVDPGPGSARAALDSLVSAGLVDPERAHHSVAGDGVLARALRAALVRMGADTGPGGDPVTALDDGTRLPTTGAVCWTEGRLAVLAPPGVTPRDVAARRRAATRHRDTDPRTRPLPGASAVTAPVPRAGIELAATVVAAELLRRDRPTHEVLAIDLDALTTSRHAVLPVPPGPR